MWGRRQVPDLDAAVFTGAGEQLAVGREIHAEDQALVFRQGPLLLARGHVPDEHFAGIQPGRQELAVWREGDRPGVVFEGKGCPLLARGDIDQLQPPVDARSRQCLAVGRERDRPEKGTRLDDQADSVRACFPERDLARRIGRGRRGEGLAVGCDREALDRRRLLGKLDRFAPGGSVSQILIVWSSLQEASVLPSGRTRRFGPAWYARRAWPSASSFPGPRRSSRRCSHHWPETCRRMKTPRK